MKHSELISKWKRDDKFNKAYAELEDEFSLFDEMLTTRKKAGLTQAQVAEKMQTKVPAIARLEASGGKHKHSPSLNTLRKYADALGYRLVIKFEKLRVKRT
jgi:transcriptional regulator with XRE-family HTH domain